jgi:prepilin-type N-terminal cleavage/methylation domain-containing protein
MRTRRNQQGYTLIELIIVMVIVAILSTVSIQTYANLQQDTKQAGAQGVAGALSSASVANYTLRSGNITSVPTMAVTDCVDVGNLLVPGSLTSYAITAKPIAPGATATCTIDHVKSSPGTAATFTAHGVL